MAKKAKESSLNKAKTNPNKVKPSESVPKKTSGRFKNVKTPKKINAKIPKVAPNPLDASEQGLSDAWERSVKKPIGNKATPTKPVNKPNTSVVNRNEIVKRSSTQPASTNSASKSIATPTKKTAGKAIANNSTQKRVLSLGKKVVKTTGGGALAPILALAAATLPVDQIGKRSDSKKIQRKQGYKRPALNQSMEKMVDPTFGGGYVKKNAPGGLQPGSTKNLERFDNVKAFKKPVPTTPAKKPTLLKPLPEAIEVKQLKVTPLQPKPAPKKISKVESGVKNSPDVFSQFMSNMLDVKVTPSTTGSDGKMVFPKHDTTGTTASNQYGGPIYGKIKRRNK